MTAVWFEVNEYTPSIKPVRVLKETPMQVVLADSYRANARRNKAGAYFPTWEEAHEFLMSVAQRELDMARLALSRAQGKHGNVKGMKKPETFEWETTR